MTNFLVRQADTLSGEVLDTPIAIIGAGAIGSFVALSLAKMGFHNLEVWDDDVVSVENMNCQFYPLTALDRPKVDALSELISSFTGISIVGVQGKFGESRRRYRTGPYIIISAVDSMEARKFIYDTSGIIAHTIIDPRMSIEYAHIQCVDLGDPEQTESYRKSLFSDDEAVQERCTNKSIMYTVLTISGLVCKMVKDRVTEKSYVKNVMYAIGDNEMMAFQHKAKGGDDGEN